MIGDTVDTVDTNSNKDVQKKDFIVVLVVGLIVIAFVVAILVATYIAQAK